MPAPSFPNSNTEPENKSHLRGLEGGQEEHKWKGERVSDVRTVGDGLLRKNPGGKGNRTVFEEVGDGILVLHAKSAGLNILEGNTSSVPGAAVREERQMDEVEEVGSEGAGCRRGK
jgi:hypothetical protein